MNEEWLSERINELRTKYKIPKEFNETQYTDNLTKVNLFLDEHKNDKNIKLIVNEEDEDGDSYYYSFFYDGTYYKIILDSRFSYDGLSKYCIFFIKNKEKWKKDFEFVNEKVLIKPGAYTIAKGSYGLFLKKIKIEHTKAPFLNDNTEDKVFKNIQNFFSNKKFYKDNNMPFKRGILFYGTPGNGKTMFIKYFTNKLIEEKNYIVIVYDCKNNELYEDSVEYLNIVCGNTPRIIIMEDIDGVSDFHRSELLNFLDGIKPLNNTFVIATTNYPDKVDPGLVSRPSRFDRIYFIDKPNKINRKRLLKFYFKEASDTELEEYACMTKGFSGAYFKELFIMKNINNISIMDAIKSIDAQINFVKEFHSDYKNYMG